MIVIHKRNNLLRVRLNVNAKYEEVAESLQRLQRQPVGRNIHSIDMVDGVVGLAGADGVRIPLVQGAIVEIDLWRAKDVKSPSGIQLKNENDAGIRWDLIPRLDAVAVLLDLTLIRDVVEYSKHFPIRVDHEGPIMSLDENGDPKGRIDRSVYHVKTADGEWKVESKNQGLRDLTEKYGGDDYQKVY